MKTTLDIPDELMKTVKLRAVEENRTLTDLIAELLRRGLAEEPMESGTIRNRVQLPLILVAHNARPEDEITPERAAEILLKEDIKAYRDSVR
jgi:hypothetical protein